MADQSNSRGIYMVQLRSGVVKIGHTAQWFTRKTQLNRLGGGIIRHWFYLCLFHAEREKLVHARLKPYTRVGREWYDPKDLKLLQATIHTCLK